MSYHGLMALQVAFLVAFTQLIPEHQVQVFGGLFKMRVKSLPMLYVTVSNVACVLGYQSPYILVRLSDSTICPALTDAPMSLGLPPQIQFGWLVSWFYLRFIKYNEGGDFRGDRSETFSFANWFPPFAQCVGSLLPGLQAYSSALPSSAHKHESVLTLVARLAGST